MTREFIELGSAPYNEDCAQVGSKDYISDALQEGERYIKMLRRRFGKEPVHAKLAIKAFHHDFGTYHEVVCYYNEDDAESEGYCLWIENNLPGDWNDDKVIGMPIWMA